MNWTQIIVMPLLNVFVYVMACYESRRYVRESEEKMKDFIEKTLNRRGR